MITCRWFFSGRLLVSQFAEWIVQKVTKWGTKAKKRMNKQVDYFTALVRNPFAALTANGSPLISMLGVCNDDTDSTSFCDVERKMTSSPVGTITRVRSKTLPTTEWISNASQGGSKMIIVFVVLLFVLLVDFMKCSCVVAGHNVNQTLHEFDFCFL